MRSNCSSMSFLPRLGNLCQFGPWRLNQGYHGVGEPLNGRDPCTSEGLLPCMVGFTQAALAHWNQPQGSAGREIRFVGLRARVRGHSLTIGCPTRTGSVAAHCSACGSESKLPTTCFTNSRIHLFTERHRPILLLLPSLCQSLPCTNSAPTFCIENPAPRLFINSNIFHPSFRMQWAWLNSCI